MHKIGTHWWLAAGGTSVSYGAIQESIFHLDNLPLRYHLKINLEWVAKQE